MYIRKTCDILHIQSHTIPRGILMCCINTGSLHSRLNMTTFWLAIVILKRKCPFHEWPNGQTPTVALAAAVTLWAGSVLRAARRSAATWRRSDYKRIVERVCGCNCFDSRYICRYLIFGDHCGHRSGGVVTITFVGRSTPVNECIWHWGKFRRERESGGASHEQIQDTK